MKIVKILAITALAISLSVVVAYGAWREQHAQYFTDASLDNMVGEEVNYCDDSSSAWGTSAAYIGHFDIDCSTGDVINVSCYHWNGTSYDSVPCYYEGDPLNGGRLRVPIG